MLAARTAWLLVPLLFLGPVASAQSPGTRVRLEGNTLDALTLQISYTGVDFSDPASVIRAKAEIDAILEARLETHFALVLVGEMTRAYASLLDPAVLERELQREDLEDARGRNERYARAGVAVTLGRPESRAQDRYLYPVIVTTSADGTELEKRSFRMDVAKGPDGRWLVLRSEYLCGDCQGIGKRGETACDPCAGLGWVEKPLVALPGGIDAPGGDPAGPAGDDAKSVAAAFLRARASVSRRVLAGYARQVGTVYREYCARFAAPSSVPPAGDGGSPFSGDLTYETGELQPDEDSVYVAVRETQSVAGARPTVTPMMVHVIRTPAGLRVESFGIPCRACAGTGGCSLCQGTGLVDDRPCTGCEGTRTCMACQGKRVVLTEPFAPRF